jgi:serine/threonine protein phosphatase PrpC
MEETRETVPVSIPPLGWACGCTRRGSSHARDGRPCQDAHALWSSSFLGEPLLVLAVADGHGGERHDLSHCGAAIAVQSAVGEVIASLPTTSGGDALQPVPQGRGGGFHHRVTERWKEEVKADAERRTGLSMGEDTGKELFSRYGSTLLIAVIDGSEGWVGRIGDGDILLVRPDGSVEAPLPKDEELLGTVTYSLSSREAPVLWKTARFPVGPGGLLLLATDGLSDSFEDPDTGIRVFARSLADRLASFGIGKIGDAIPGWLDGYSRDGSGDDMTLAIALLSPSQVAPGEGEKPGGPGDGATSGDGEGPADEPGVKEPAAGVDGGEGPGEEGEPGAP